MAVTTFTLRRKGSLSRLNRGSVLAKARHIRILLLVPPIVGHIASLITVDVRVTARPVCLVMDCLQGYGARFRIAVAGSGWLAELSNLRVASLGRRVRFGVAAVVKSDVGVAPTAVRAIDSRLARNLVMFA